MTDNTIDSVLDKVLGRHSVHYNYSKRETRERLTQAITNLIAQEANKAAKAARVETLKSIDDFMHGRSDTFNNGNPYLIAMETSEVSEEIHERIKVLTADKEQE